MAVSEEIMNWWARDARDFRKRHNLGYDILIEKFDYDDSTCTCCLGIKNLWRHKLTLKHNKNMIREYNLPQRVVMMKSIENLEQECSLFPIAVSELPFPTLSTSSKETAIISDSGLAFIPLTKSKSLLLPPRPIEYNNKMVNFYINFKTHRQFMLIKPLNFHAFIYGAWITRYVKVQLHYFMSVFMKRNEERRQRSCHHYKYNGYKKRKTFWKCLWCGKVLTLKVGERPAPKSNKRLICLTNFMRRP